MKRFFTIFLMILTFTGCYYKKSPKMRFCIRLDWQSVVDMFPKNKHDAHTLAVETIKIMDEMLESLQAIDKNKCTFYNTVRLYDNTKLKFITNMQILSTLATLSSDPQLRIAAHNGLLAMQKYQADKLVRSPILLHVFQDYVQYGTDDQSKTMLTRLFLQKSINALEHEGAHFTPEILSILNKLSQEMAALQAQFISNIHNHNRSIQFQAHELAGVPDSFLAGCVMHDNQYTILLTYDSFFAILENCANASTRKKMFTAFNNRAYPENLEILQKLIAKRNEYARLVGYSNFAEYESCQQMIGSVKRAQDFIHDMVDQTNKIVKNEFGQLIQDLPSSVTLSFSGKLQPWDEAFVKAAYRKKHYDLDTMQLAQYFPLSHVMIELQKQFGQFFALSFDEVSAQGLWDKHLISWQVRLLKTSEIIGYIVFDLYARPGKAEQASQMNVIPAIHDDCNLSCSGVSTIVTNFAKPHAGKETLLELYDVKMLLHEFGHALHELFGATDFVDFAGTKGPRDFIEVPSQLFEMWLDEPEIIKSFSSHYQTHEQLSDKMIEKIVIAEKFGRASLLQRQCLLSLISLELGCCNGTENIHNIVEKLYKSVRCDVEYDSQDHFETGFEHLITYGSHYYGYVWSQVLAAGLFEYVCKQGIHNTNVGQELYASLLKHGGSNDPHVLIELLLGTNITKQSLLNSL